MREFCRADVDMSSVGLSIVLPRLVMCTILAIFLFAPLSVAAQGNLLIVVADDLGVDNFCLFRGGCEDGSFPATPRLDAMVEAGLRFDDAWANPVCSTTRSTIQTGLYSRRTGVLGATGREGTNGLAGDTVTFAEIVAGVLPRRPGAQTYSRAAFGKWHLNNDVDFTSGSGSPIDLHGFEFFEGTVANLERFDGDYCSYSLYTMAPGGITTPTDSFEYATSQTTTSALQWIDDNRDNQPWLVYLAYHTPHSPFHRVDTLTDAGVQFADLPRDAYGCLECIDGEEDECATDVIEVLDSEIGYIEDVLNAWGQDDTPVDFPTILFLGDNGSARKVIDPAFNPLVESENHAKGSVFQGGVHVPFFAFGTGVTPGVVDDMVSTVDIFATVSDLAGVEPSFAHSGTDSVSLFPYLEGLDCGGPCRDHAYAEIYNDSPSADALAYRNAVSKRYKLIRDCKGGLGCPGKGCLFDLEVDPHEENRLTNADDCFRPDGKTFSCRKVRDQLAARLDSHLLAFDNVCEFGSQDTCDWIADAAANFCLVPSSPDSLSVP